MNDKQQQAVTDALFNVTAVANDLGNSYKNVSILQKGNPNATFKINFTLPDILEILQKLEVAHISLMYLQKEGERKPANKNYKEKYQWFVEHLGIMQYHPFQNNYDNCFASFGDNIPDEIWKDAKTWFKNSPLYKELSDIHLAKTKEDQP